MPAGHGATGWTSTASVDVESALTIVVKTFERPDALRRLVESIRRFYPDISVIVIDDSAQPLDPPPEGVSRYWHHPYNSLGAAGGRNVGLRKVETPFVLFSDDDMVFERRTDLARMVAAVDAMPFDVVSCVWLDFDPWTGICRGPRRFEGTLDVEDGLLVHRLGATRGTVFGLPVFDIVHQFFLARLDRLGPDPWDAELNLSEHYELFLHLAERGLACTRLPDVVVQHRPELPYEYLGVRSDTREYVDRWLAKRALRGRRQDGSLFRASDRIRYGVPGSATYAWRRAARVGRRLVTERRIRA